MSSATNVNRKRSRWDNDREKVVAPSHASIPDDAAIQALMNEAQARQVERDRNQQNERVENKKRHDLVAHQRKSRDTTDKSGKQGEDSYYGPASLTTNDNGGDEEAVVEKERPNFGISGALAKDAKAGNMYRGVLLKFQEPPEARAPNTLWRLYAYKGDELLETLHISRQSAYLLGRNADIADIPLLHPSCSSQHAVIQFRAIIDPSTGKTNTQPYLMDLESSNGTTLNGVPLDGARYYQLKKGDVMRFGASTREYVLLTAATKKI
ncbi:hypothetical protein MPSEU_000734200 [Mayamaea pseudoterrestris]|nr:hypothetical protein MPSEU_000734200 [Mayamaea pseudoterrestris]